jgi:hypothetical protein
MSTEPVLFDPRLLPDYDPSLMPLCDGEDPPPKETEDRNLQRVIEFASVYYQMNLLAARADSARRAGDLEGERLALEAFRSTSRQRDLLEDRYAAEGFIAEPILKGDRYVELIFNWAGKRPKDSLYSKRFEITLEL